MTDSVAQRRPRAIAGEIETSRLANGLELCLLRNPQAPIVSTALVYRVGARDEERGRSGTAHFLEHMMFKGSEHYAPGEVDRRTQALGGNNNAFTSHDLTAYWFSFAADRWDEALAIETDRMRGLRLDPEQVDSERNVIGEEISMYEDEPWDVLSQAVERALYGDHPYGRPVLGTVEELATTGRVELDAFHHCFYRPGNAVLVVAGALDDDAGEIVGDAFANLGADGPKRLDVAPPQPLEGRTRVERSKGDLTRLMLALPAPPVAAAEHGELRLLAALLVEGRASRLQRSLVEEGHLCLGVSASVADNEVASMFAISAELLPGTDPSEVESRVDVELARLREQPIDEAELERARQVFFTDWVYGQERIHQQALTAALALAQGDIELPSRLLDAVAGATPERLAAVARRWLDPERGSVAGICRAENGATT